MSAAGQVALSAEEERAAREKLARLHRLLGRLRAAVVAFSGGVDSAFLAFIAHQALGDRALAVTADSPSLGRLELQQAVAFARMHGIHHEVITTTEMEDQRYVRNAGDRCYFCKGALMDVLEAISGTLGKSQILVGVNIDDLGDYRPGQQAVKERGARVPLVDVGLSKREIRWLSKDLGLSTWNKPAAACLSSRIAYGVSVTEQRLHQVETAEEALRRLGLARQLRVRDEGSDLARIEVDAEVLPLVLAKRVDVVRILKEAGFRYVTLDLEGYRQGSHNARLVIRALPMIPVRGGSAV